MSSPISRASESPRRTNGKSRGADPPPINSVICTTARSRAKSTATISAMYSVSGASSVSWVIAIASVSYSPKRLSMTWALVRMRPSAETIVPEPHHTASPPESAWIWTTERARSDTETGLCVSSGVGDAVGVAAVVGSSSSSPPLPQAVSVSMAASTAARRPSILIRKLLRFVCWDSRRRASQGQAGRRGAREG